MSVGADYSAGRPRPQKLKQAGVKFVCRYLSTPGNPKNLTQAEALALRVVGIKVVTVFETTAGRAAAGAAAGRADARAALAQLVALQAPVDAPCYFAVDFDIPDYAPNLQPDNARAKLGPVGAYFEAVSSVFGKRRIGGYGGYWAVSRLLDAGLVEYAWQTRAWSAGRWDTRAHIRQKGSGTIDHVAIDWNESRAADYGQWYATPAPKPPRPVPVYPSDDTFWTWVAWRTGTGVFEPYGPRAADVRPNVPQRIPAAWWRGLKAYMKAGT